MNEQQFRVMVLQSIETGNYCELCEVLRRAENYRSGIKGSIEWLTKELEHLNRSLKHVEQSIEFINSIKNELEKKGENASN